jgi:ribosomal peptide maturation radical SAM protein 1
MKVQLINMPFSALYIPSLALTQLKSTLAKSLGDRVSVEIHYLNHQFGVYLGTEIYEFIAENLSAHVTGFGDWFFRQAAFPALPDNSAEYFSRYAPQFGPQALTRYEQLLKGKREKLIPFFDDLIDQHRLDQADLVGFTSMFFQTLASAALARRLKERNPKIVTLMGGANCEARMGIELVQHLEKVDFAFSGPALVNLPQFIEFLLRGEEAKCHRIDGVFSKENCRSVSAVDPQESKQVKDQDLLLHGVGLMGRELDINVPVELDYEGFLDSFQSKFAGKNIEPYLLFETSRGCWWGQKSHCTFCGLNGGTMNYRALRSDAAVELMQGLFNRYAGQVNHFSSVDNIVPKNYFAEVFPRLQVPANASLFYEVKADLRNEEMRILAQAHVFDIQPGIESLSSSTLRLMRKGTTAFGNLQFLRGAALYGIKPCWNLLVGFPGEKEDVFQKYLDDIPALTHLPPPSGTFPVRFDRFSPYFDQAREYHLDLHPLDFYRLSYPFDKDVLQNMAYYFADHNYKADYITAVTRFIKPLQDKISEWRARWQGKEGLLPPRLYFKQGANSGLIYDSRSGAMVLHQLSDLEKTVLRALDTPNGLDLLAKSLPLDPGAIQQGITSLTAKKLLFYERDRWMSLVLPDAPAMAQRKSYH